MKPILVSAVLAVLVLSGCGGTQLDNKKLEETLPHDLRPVVSEPIKSASCPSGIDVEKGVKFDCQIVLENGKKETVHLKLTDDNADYEFISVSPQK
jgi:Domain of unknown function (DUF4333)